MTVEDLLTRALADEAESRDVDVVALHLEVQRRLPARSRHRRRPVLVGVAAAGVLIAGVAGGLALTGPDDATRQYGDAADGRVATEFACPVVNEIDFRTTEDDGFLPDLSQGNSPAEVAALERAATFDFTTSGDTATLRLGNADGSLGSVTTYDRVGGGLWRMRTARVCAGAGDLPLAPTDDVLRLGEHGAEPWPVTALFGRYGEAAAFVDDRPYYNLAGVIEGHRSIYVQPCERDGWCWRSGEPTSQLIGDRIPPSAETGRPSDVSDFLVDPDLMVGRENPFGIWAYDVDGPGSLSAVLRDGSVVRAREVTHPAWDGRRVLVVMAVRADVASLEFTDGAGELTSWRPDEIPGD